jgi:hypothetical protein
MEAKEMNTNTWNIMIECDLDLVFMQVTGKELVSTEDTINVDGVTIAFPDCQIHSCNIQIHVDTI